MRERNQDGKLDASNTEGPATLGVRAWHKDRDQSPTGADYPRYYRNPERLTFCSPA